MYSLIGGLFTNRREPITHFEVAAFSRLRKNFDSSTFREGHDFSRAVKSLKISEREKGWREMSRPEYCPRSESSTAGVVYCGKTSPRRLPHPRPSSVEDPGA